MAPATSSWGEIPYSRFSSSGTASIVQAEIEYFSQLKKDFEWTVYSHDEPPDLLTQLRNCGFRIGEEESLMIRDSLELSPVLGELPAGVTVSPVSDEPSIRDYLCVETAIWSCEPRKTREVILSTLRDPLQHDLGFVAYSDGKPIGCGRVTGTPHSQFSGLWGGSVLHDFRGRGVYRALLCTRIQHVRQLIGFVINGWMRCPQAGQFWRNTDSSESPPPGPRNGFQDNNLPFRGARRLGWLENLTSAG